MRPFDRKVFQFDFISAEPSFTGSKSSKVDVRDTAGLEHHRVGEFRYSKLELRSHFRHQSIDYQSRSGSGSTWSTRVLTFSRSLYLGVHYQQLSSSSKWRVQQKFQNKIKLTHGDPR